MPSYRLLGITNSLRAGSLNRQALALAHELLPQEATMAVHDLAGIPFYDIELERRGLPAEVQALARALHGCDGVVLCSPEYNHSIPAIIKNAIDWASRVPSLPFDGKPIMLLSATPGLLGGARVQYELRRVLDAVGATAMVKPEVFIGSADRKFDEQGLCTDERTRQAVAAQLKAFVLWVERSRRVMERGVEQA